MLSLPAVHYTWLSSRRGSTWLLVPAADSGWWNMHWEKGYSFPLENLMVLSGENSHVQPEMAGTEK